MKHFCEFALNVGRDDLLDLMLENGARVNVKKRRGSVDISCSFPYRKTGFSSVRMWRPIIAAGANVNIFCSTGLNLLMMAINNDAFVHAVILLNAGADQWIRSEALNLNAIKFVLSQKRIVLLK